MISKSWRKNWDNLKEIFSYPPEIRRAIYTTNAVESLNISLRKVTKNRTAFPADNPLIKIFHLALTNALKKWTMPFKEWVVALN